MSSRTAQSASKSHPASDGFTDKDRCVLLEIADGIKTLTTMATQQLVTQSEGCSGPAELHSDQAASTVNRFEKDGPMFRLRFHAHDATEEDEFVGKNGFRYYALLLSQPNVAMEASDFFPQPHGGLGQDDPDEEGVNSRADAGADDSYQPAIDKAEVDRQIRKFKHDIAEAEKDGALARAAELKKQLMSHLQHKKENTGVFGRVRHLGPAPVRQRRRKAVDASLRRCRAVIGKTMPMLKMYLKAHVKWNGTQIAYIPTAPVEWRL